MESLTSIASCSVDASFCLVFKKINATNFRNSSCATKFISLEILSHEILQHGNFPIYGIVSGKSGTHSNSSDISAHAQTVHSQHVGNPLVFRA